MSREELSAKLDEVRTKCTNSVSVGPTNIFIYYTGNGVAVNGYLSIPFPGAPLDDAICIEDFKKEIASWKNNSVMSFMDCSRGLVKTKGLTGQFAY